MKLQSQSFKSFSEELQEIRKNESKEKNKLKAEKRVRKHEKRITLIDENVFEELKSQLDKGELKLPDDAIQHLIRSIIERDFLNISVNDVSFTAGELLKEQGWIRISRLPVSPLEEKKYAMFPRWQNAIATMHNLKHRLCYVLLRQNGETQLYLGAIPTIQGKKGNLAEGQLKQAITAQMPGIGVEKVEEPVSMLMSNLRCCGAITGIPSVRKITEYGEYQTMDQIAMGLRNSEGGEQDFAVIVVADPVSDERVVDILRSLENLGSEIHALTQYTKTEGTNSGSNISLAYSDGTNTGVSGGGSIGYNLGEVLKADINVGVSHGWFASTSNVRGANVGVSDSISIQYINKSAMYCEALFDKHIERMKAGRNLGFWKTGVYVLSDSVENTETVMGMLRAVYSGDDTYIEPIRTTIMPDNCGADLVVKQFQHLPFEYPPVEKAFGSIYEDYATPMTTEELSIATSLPRRDVPGLRLIRNASRFTTNPPVIKEKREGGKPVRLGEVLDTGAPTQQIYQLDLNQLVRHALIAGTNGSGKTNTCKSILDKVQREGIPFLVIEPTKDEYMDWAIAQNKVREQSGKKKIHIFAPGYFGDLGVSLKQKNEILALSESFDNLSDKQKKLVPRQARQRLNALLGELNSLTGEIDKKQIIINKQAKLTDITKKDRSVAAELAEKISRIGDVKDLHLNLFQPTVMNGTWINIMTHLDRIKSVLINSMPMSDVLPLVMMDTLFVHAKDKMDIKNCAMNGEVDVLKDMYQDDGSIQYPKIEDMDKTAHGIIDGRNYADEVKNNLKAAMSTRVNALILGWKEDLFNVVRSTNLAQLFEEEVVINLSYLADDTDKALVMSLLLVALWEYRESRYKNDRGYKKKADNNELMHLTLIEEAHRLMPDVMEDGSGMNSQQITAKMFSNMLSEIRAYGEGCIVVDQVPTRLIPDAVKNTNLKIIHRLTAADDIQSVSTSMRLRPDQQAVIGALQPGEAIACSDYDDAAAWVKVDESAKY